MQNDMNLFVASIQKCYPEVDAAVLQFIHKWMTSPDGPPWNPRAVNPQQKVTKYKAGFFAYAFAEILQSQFKRGEIFVSVSTSEFVWMDNNIPYFCDGVHTEQTSFIPCKQLTEQELNNLLKTQG